MTPLRAAARRVASGTGTAEVPRRAMIFTVGLAVVATIVTIVGLSLPAPLPVEDPLSQIERLGIATGVMAMAQLASLRLRVGTGRLSVGWGEAALIIGLYIAPAGWLPAATFVGVGLAWLLLSIFADLRTPIEAVQIAICQTIAVAAGVLVAGALSDPIGASLTPALAGALVLGALTYTLVGAFLAVVSMCLKHGGPLRTTLVRALHDKLLMFVGNVIVGLVVVSLVDRDPRWLLLLPPALWLLQQTYGHRLRADDERRAWQEFATGIGDLNRLDEREVAAAAVSHSLRLFGAERVELDVLRSDGVVRRYTGDSAGERADTEAHERSSSAEGESTLVRRLSVADVQVGELRVELPRATLPSPRDELALNAFAEALAAALHDSAAHRELGIVKGIAAYEAVHDQLTSLHSRTAMLARGDEVLCGLEHGTPVALVLIDVNRFRDVNDTLGHAAGDELLQALADRLGTLVDGDDVLGRMGGDEFALLITATPEPAPQAAIGNRDDAQPAALRKARALVEQLAHPVEVQGVRMSVEASAGVVVAGAGTVGMTELLRRADVALYQAKDGGSSVAWYDSSRDVASTDQLALLAELREALAVDDQLYLVLQPAVDLSTGEPTGVEALIRWRHPRRNNLMPAEFVRAAEGSEMVGLFTRYVIDKALEVAADIVAHDMTVPISVNLSAQSLLDPTLPADINELLRRHGVPSNQLVVEITETVVLRELDVVDEVLGALRQMGVRLAVDDFGTGFSSLSFLDRIEVDELKVDRSFVMRMGESPQAAAIVQSIVELGHRMHLRVVAEGVETAAQRAALVDLGCSAAQGYHFFKPMPADKIVTVLGELLDGAQAQIYPLRDSDAS